MADFGAMKGHCMGEGGLANTTNKLLLVFENCFCTDLTPLMRYSPVYCRLLFCWHSELSSEEGTREVLTCLKHTLEPVR